jgi:hypothetical protein
LFTLGLLNGLHLRTDHVWPLLAAVWVMMLLVLMGRASARQLDEARR